jgi:hypothetical protein
MWFFGIPPVHRRGSFQGSEIAPITCRRASRSFGGVAKRSGEGRCRSADRDQSGGKKRQPFLIRKDCPRSISVRLRIATSFAAHSRPEAFLFSGGKKEENRDDSPCPPLSGVDHRRLLTRCQPNSPCFPAFAEFSDGVWEVTRRIPACNGCEENNARPHSLPARQPWLYCQSQSRLREKRHEALIDTR